MGLIPKQCTLPKLGSCIINPKDLAFKINLVI